MPPLVVRFLMLGYTFLSTSERPSTKQFFDTLQTTLSQRSRFSTPPVIRTMLFCLAHIERLHILITMPILYPDPAHDFVDILPPLLEGSEWMEHNVGS
jgi:hypothetical protein